MLEANVVGREAVADWIETTLLLLGTRQLGTDRLLEMARDEIQCESPQVNLALRVMGRRADVLGTHYPFDVHQVAVRARPAAVDSAYVALMLLTPDSIARQVNYRIPTEEMVLLFERLTESALSQLWGTASRSLRFGHPSEHGRPVEFAAAIEWLAKQLGIPVGSGYRPPSRKDGGVDVVAWRPFPDGRSGFPLLLTQCTLQANILPKSADIDVRLWASWLALDFEPMTALAVPQTVQQGVLWDQLALRCMVLDRVRLAGLVNPACEVAGLAQWSTQTIDGLYEVMIGGQS